ncbi:MAG: proprotein convertase P-domain-containing protein [Saprospiraceae bacterium]
MTLKEKLVNLDELVSKGKFEEAIEKYFHPRVVSLSNHDDVIIGKEDKLLSMRNFKESMARFNHIGVRQQAIGDNVTMSEYLFDFVYKFGKRVIKEEIIRRIWEDGMVIEERYYALDTRPPFNPISKEGIPYLFVEKDEVPKKLATSESITVNEEEDAEVETPVSPTKPVEPAKVAVEETPVVETTEPVAPPVTEEVEEVEEVEETEEEVVLSRGIPSTPVVETETPAVEKEEKAPNEEEALTSSQEERLEVSVKESIASTESVESVASNVIDNSKDGFLSKSVKTYLEIPDNTDAPLVSTLSFTGKGLVGSVVLNLDLDHTYVGSLTIELESPYGERVLVQKEEGGSMSSIKKSYSKYLFTAIEGEPVEGSWKLILSDNSPYDSGWLNEWGLEIDIA